MPDTLAIVNRWAGRGRCGKQWPDIAAGLRKAGVSFDFAFTNGPGDATWLTEEAIRRGVTTVAAVGGDGTAHEVVNGYFERDPDAVIPINPEARFALLPCGTGGDLARALELGRGSRLQDAIAALGTNGATRSIDLGRVRYTAHDGQIARRYFLVGADLGLGGETTALVEAQPARAKAMGGLLTYLIAAIGAVLAHRPAEITYAIDDRLPISAKVNMLFVANGAYTGAGMHIAPAASLDDGRFDVLILQNTPKVEILTRLLPAIYRGAHLSHPAVQHLRASRVQVEASARLLLQVDGEQPGRAPAEFTIAPKALRVATTGLHEAPSP
jgi:diacylglycerol kinase (ATP)